MCCYIDNSAPLYRQGQILGNQRFVKLQMRMEEKQIGAYGYTRRSKLKSCNILPLLNIRLVHVYPKSNRPRRTMNEIDV